MNAPQPSVRPSAIAGQWYPGSALALRATVEQYLSAAESLRPRVGPPPAATHSGVRGRLLALVAPHAGYVYSGPIAARAFARVRGAGFSRVVLFGPLHRPVRRGPMGPFMIPAEDAYRTPLGDVPIDRAFLKELARSVPLTEVREDQEHSLEIELPFLQVALPRFSLVPILFGEHVTERGALSRADSLAGALARAWDASTLLVVSTDLTHSADYDAVHRSDAVLVELVERLDAGGLITAFRDGAAQACGATGLVTALRLAERLGAREVAILEHTTSSDVNTSADVTTSAARDKRSAPYTVGYLAAAIYA